MDLVVTGVVAGVLGTLVMDFLNHLCARTGMISKIEVGMIGRMAAGWARGRFRYGHPSEMQQVANEKLFVMSRTTPSAWASRFRTCLDGLSWSEGLFHRYGHWPMVSLRRWPPTSSFCLPWGLECVAGGLPKA